MGLNYVSKKHRKQNLLSQGSTYFQIKEIFMEPDAKKHAVTTPERLPRSQSVAAGRGMQKEYLPEKTMCRVTFKLSKAAAAGAQSVTLAGDFNNWDTHINPLRKLKSGTWFLAQVLEAGKNYQFRYCIDESRWANDGTADRYEKSLFDNSDTSVVTV